MRNRLLMYVYTPVNIFSVVAHYCWSPVRLFSGVVNGTLYLTHDTSLIVTTLCAVSYSPQLLLCIWLCWLCVWSNDSFCIVLLICSMIRRHLIKILGLLTRNKERVAWRVCCSGYAVWGWDVGGEWGTEKRVECFRDEMYERDGRSDADGYVLLWRCANSKDDGKKAEGLSIFANSAVVWTHRGDEGREIRWTGDESSGEGT